MVRPIEDVLVEAAAAALPRELLAAVAAAGSPTASLREGEVAAPSGRIRKSPTHGRPLGARQGDPRGGARLDLLRTLAAAAPWQVSRRRETCVAQEVRVRDSPPILLRSGDFRVRRYKPRTERTTIFAVDASGSQALHRLAEAKGAVELLLADCYVRRDRVAVLAFRGQGAELLLPPTRSLVRAKRCLAGLPGGGPTPLAAGIDAAQRLALAIARQGGLPLLVMLSDFKANITRRGEPGRESAQLDAMAAARAWRQVGTGALLVDTAPEPQSRAREIAVAMNARLVVLPHADARALARAIGVRGVPST